MSKLRICNVTKQFPGTLALDDVCVEFESGQVNALIGKNGSGKSTLVKIISGAQPATEGEAFLDDLPLSFSSPEEAIENGIATVYQELSLVPGLTVAENILLGRFPMKGPFIDWEQTFSQSQEHLNSMGVDIDPRTPVHELAMWQCQIVEIVKAMSTNPKVILLDEPTSSLSRGETEILFKLIRELKKKDVVILYISHRLQELWEIADNCTVLRDGVLVGREQMQNMTHQKLIHLMFGDVEIRKRPDDLTFDKEDVVLRVRDLESGNRVRGVSFDVRRGEIVGIAGMLGSGRTELLRALYGADKPTGGSIEFFGHSVPRVKPTTMKGLGFGFTPEDRKVDGLVQVLSVKENLVLASLRRQSTGPFINREKEGKAVDAQVQNLDIKISSVDDSVAELSGGNQQKVVVGNWLNNQPMLMLFDEPSRGIDVQSKQQIFKIIWDMSRQGISSIVVSSELEELLEVCHRIIIMGYGLFEGEVAPENTTIQELYSLCIGGVEK